MGLSIEFFFFATAKVKHLVEPWGFEPQTSSMPFEKDSKECG